MWGSNLQFSAKTRHLVTSKRRLGCDSQVTVHPGERREAHLVGEYKKNWSRDSSAQSDFFKPLRDDHRKQSYSSTVLRVQALIQRCQPSWLQMCENHVKSLHFQEKMSNTKYRGVIYNSLLRIHRWTLWTLCWHKAWGRSFRAMAARALCARRGHMEDSWRKP